MTRHTRTVRQMSQFERVSDDASCDHEGAGVARKKLRGNSNFPVQPTSEHEVTGDWTPVPVVDLLLIYPSALVALRRP